MGKESTERFAVLSIHLSPPLSCLSRCLMVYYGKPKPFQVNVDTGFVLSVRLQLQSTSSEEEGLDHSAPFTLWLKIALNNRFLICF